MPPLIICVPSNIYGLNFNDIEIRIFIRRLIEIISNDVKQRRFYIYKK